jgi:hypothetical protein
MGDSEGNEEKGSFMLIKIVGQGRTLHACNTRLEVIGTVFEKQKNIS